MLKIQTNDQTFENNQSDTIINQTGETPLLQGGESILNQSTMGGDFSGSHYSMIFDHWKWLAPKFSYEYHCNFIGILPQNSLL